MTVKIQVKRSKVLRHPKLILTILHHTPTLDPLAIVLNSDLFYVEGFNGEVAAFVTLKKFGPMNELGTVFTYPAHRGNGLSTALLNVVLPQFNEVYLLCKPDLEGFYGKLGFEICHTGHRNIIPRRNLFNRWLGLLFGYKLLAMKRG